MLCYNNTTNFFAYVYRGGMPNKKDLSIKVSKGKLPTIPKDVKESNNTVIRSIYKAMKKCYTYDPGVRPSARVIANDLISVLHSLKK